MAARSAHAAAGDAGGRVSQRTIIRHSSIIAAVRIVIIPEGYGPAAGTLVMAVLESTCEASAAEVSAAQAATDATAAHGTAPMTGSAVTARNGVGRDGSTSQCRDNNDDRNPVQ